METYNSKISDFGFGDIKSSLLSLQFLDQVAPIESQQNCVKLNQSQGAKIDARMQTKQNLCQLNRMNQWNQNSNYNICQTKSIDLSKTENDIQPRKLFEVQSDRCCLSQLQNVPAIDHSNVDMPHSLDNIDQSHISRMASKRQSYEIDSEHQEAPHHQHQLNILKQLQEKAIAQIRESEYAEQVKQNFQVLFQKVYGIIQEIEQRNDKTNDLTQSVRTDAKPSAKKELSISTKVIQLSVGKQQNQKLKKKKFCHLQTQFDYDNESCDEGTSIFNPQLRTEQNWCTKSPFPSTARAKPSLLSLSKQYPTIVSPAKNMDSARSNKSSKSKGLTLVSVDKKILEPTEVNQQNKKAVKITLMQKRIVGCPKKRVVDLTSQPKTSQKKTSSFNPTSFFNSRRVSTRIV